MGVGGHAIPIFFSAAHECYILSDSTLSQQHNGTGSERTEHNSIAHAEEEKTGRESVASRHLLPASVKSGSISSNHCSVLNLNVLTNMAVADAI